MPSFWKIAAIVFALAMVWVQAPVLKGRVPFPTVFIFQFPVFAPTTPEDLDRQVPNIGDVSTAFFPYRVLASRAWTDGFPIWDPYLLSGKPFLANPQSALFYPPNFLFYVLPVPVAWTISFLLRPLLAGFFTALFLRRIGASTTGTLVASLVFAFSGFMTVWQGQAMSDSAVWLPLICYGVVRLHEERSRASVAIVALSFAMPVLAGHPETAAHLTAVGTAFALFLAFFRPASTFHWSPIRHLALFGVGGFLAMAVAAVQIAATVEWLPYLDRGLDIVWPPAPLWGLLGFVSRDVLSSVNSFGLAIPEYAAYVGMVTFVGFPLAWLHPQRKYVVFFMLSTAVAISVAYGIEPLFSISQRIPLFLALKNHRLILVATFGLAVLAGLGISAVEGLEVHERARRIRALAYSATGISIALLLIYVTQVSLLGSPVGHSRFPKASLLFLTFQTILVTLRLAGALPGKLFGVGVIGILLIDVCTFSHTFIPFDKPANILPENRFFAGIAITPVEPVRVMQIGAAYASNTELLYGIETSGGYELPLRRIREFVRGVARDEMDALMLDASGALDPSDRRMDMLGTKYYAVYNGDSRYREFLQSTDHFRFLYEYGNTSLFENLKALSPAFLVPASGATVLKEEERQMELIRSPAFDPLRTVVIERPLPSASSASANGTDPGRVSWVSRGNATFQLKVDSNSDSVLVVSQTFYPGWRAKVDGRETPVFPADYALTGIAIGPGSHDVLFSFDPPSFRIGLLVSGIATLILCILLWRR